MRSDSVYIGCSDYPEHIFSAVQQFERLSVDHPSSLNGKNGEELLGISIPAVKIASSEAIRSRSGSETVGFA